MKPRVLFSSKTADPTGPTTSLSLIIEGLSQQVDPTVVFPGDGEFRNRLVADGIAHHSVASMGRRDILSLARLIHSGKFDLVYANETSRACRHVCVAAALARTPFVSHVRSMGWQHGWARLGHLNFARKVIAVSQACGDSVARYVRGGRLHVVHNGVSAALLEEEGEVSESMIRQELGVASQAGLIVSVSHVTPRKGQVFAVDAMKYVLQVFPDAHLLLVGALDRDPGYVEEVRRLATESILRGRVTLLGFRSDVGQILSSADVLLHTALADPHPRAVLEAMAVGLPVVAFDTDGVSETVEDQGTGFLLPVRDSEGLGAALVRILENPEMAGRMGRAGRVKVVQEFSTVRTSARIRDIVADALGSSEGRS